MPKTLIVKLQVSGLGLGVDFTTGCPEKNAPQFLPNFSGYKHARRLGVQKLFCTIFGSRDICKVKWVIRFQNV